MKNLQRIMPPFSITFAADEKPAKEQVSSGQFPEKGLELEALPHCGELISGLLPPSPPFCERDFSLFMAEFFHRCAGYQSWESAEEEAPDTEHIFSRSTWTVLCSYPAAGAEPLLQMTDINGNKKRYSPYDAFNHFVRFSSDDGTASYSFLFYLFKFLNMVCYSCAFVPHVLAGDEYFKIIWRPYETIPSVSAMLTELASLECGMLSVKADNLKKMGIKSTGKTVSGRSVVDLLASDFLNEFIRRRYLLLQKFFRTGTGYEYRELLNLFFAGIEVDYSFPDKRSLPAAIDKWLSVLHINFDAYRYGLTVKVRREKNTLDDEFLFDLSMDVITEQEDGVKKTPLFKCDDLEILRTPEALSNYLPEIRELTVRSNVHLSEARLTAFLDSAAPLLTRLGLMITLPKALARELNPYLAVKASKAGSKNNQGSLKSYLSLETLQDFQWQIAIGDEVMSLQEFEKLVNQKRALVRFKDGFVKMDAEEFTRLLKKAKDAPPDYNDFLKAYFSGETILEFDARETIDNLFKEHEFSVSAGLTAQLRPYQKRGYNWICSLLFSGFGCILADDMGLGKTVQSIAVLLRLKEEGLLSNGCLIVAPAALLNNWEKELSRFAPSLSVTRYHGTHRSLAPTGSLAPSGGISRQQDVFLTTYQTAVRDAAKLNDEIFSLLLVDEAHLMKNAETRISRTVKQLRSQFRLALSGTPVENRLEDLRSLFDFILPGYLGTAEGFKKQYRVPIEVMRNKERAETLRKITSPFLLRRLKTDRKIIRDLPDKIVANEYAVLEKEQAALYESVVSESIKKSEKFEGDRERRAALVLSLLTSLKQICDHPRVYDKESPAVSKLSGKAQLLLTLLQEILANREKTIVFSQYVETLDCLERIIKNELGEAAQIYHGGLNQNTRAGIIDRFQNDMSARILLISLRAGGLGLNLTAASRVIHYDLWYNPAVENQATDRAFRIGQKRSVFVHRFITRNSFEEKIDAMITSKQELADMTVSSGESWLARMSHEELKELFDR